MRFGVFWLYIKYTFVTFETKYRFYTTWLLVNGGAKNKFFFVFIDAVEGILLFTKFGFEIALLSAEKVPILCTTKTPNLHKHKDDT